VVDCAVPTLAFCHSETGGVVKGLGRFAGGVLFLVRYKASVEWVNRLRLLCAEAIPSERQLSSKTGLSAVQVGLWWGTVTRLGNAVFRG